jgi:hypothetical protein
MQVNVDAVSLNAASVATHVNTLSTSVSEAVTNRRPFMWASWTGSSPVTDTAGYNVKSITRVIEGQYRVHFTTPYVFGSQLAVGGMAFNGAMLVDLTSTSYVVVSVYDLASNARITGGYASVIVFGDSTM